ncbi:nickel-dependent lactate racemase [Propionispora vibrioides]|uniref:Nickel-dependent lactate racemase n=1 Tax=Propionispora vibrioides TaxID=112903 RepID=A0A1H8V9R2_9FIRM|nr:Nickel-dependent lactate racemase [Propionispora vibrioides]
MSDTGNRLELEGVSDKMQEIELAFGEQSLRLVLPDVQCVDVVEGSLTPGVGNIVEAARQALAEPVGEPPLRHKVKATDKVVIIVSDITRRWVRHDLFLPVLLDELNAAGIADKQITVLVALGAHRPHSQEENLLAYGQAVVERVTIAQSYAPETDQFVRLGTTSRGVPVTVNRRVVEADRVILTGGICYHPMAGFGGGRKAILPGVSGYDSIQGNHRFCLSKVEGDGVNPHSASGRLNDNEMHLDMMEMAEMVKPDFLFNVVLNPEGEIAAFFAGHWLKAWQAGCKKVEEIYGVPVEQAADLVIVSAGGAPKDMNFYQACKAIQNAAGAVKPGGLMIAVMECRDIEDPPDFSQWFHYPSLLEAEQALRVAFTVPGFIALKTGYIARELPIIVVTLAENAAFFARTGIQAVTGLEEALQLAAKRLDLPNSRIIVLPHGGSTLPLIGA